MVVLVIQGSSCGRDWHNHCSYRYVLGGHHTLSPMLASRLSYSGSPMLASRLSYSGAILHPSTENCPIISTNLDYYLANAINILHQFIFVCFLLFSISDDFLRAPSSYSLPVKISSSSAVSPGSPDATDVPNSPSTELAVEVRTSEAMFQPSEATSSNQQPSPAAESSSLSVTIGDEMQYYGKESSTLYVYLSGNDIHIMDFVSTKR